MTEIFFILSIFINIIFSIFFAVFLYKRGGISYIAKKLFSSEKKVNNSQKPLLKEYYIDKKSIYEILKLEKNDIIFIGDSLIEACEWSELFNNIRIKNRGISADTTEEVYKRLDKILESQPKKIFIMIGTNDMGMEDNKSKIIMNYKKIMDKIINESPHTKIYIQSILPANNSFNSREKRKNEEIIKVNKQIAVLATEYKSTYIDLFSFFTTENNQLNAKYTNDGLHLNGSGYLLWKSKIEKYVNE